MKITNPRSLKLTATLLLLLAAAPGAAEPPPNFVVIFADDLGYGDLGCYGSKTIRTPRIDRMAAEGARFTDFYAAAPFCSPSRASMLTGRYPGRAGVPHVLFPTERTGLPPSEVTAAELLRQAGYATACIGKWHLGYPPALRAHRQGFDSFFGLPYSNDMYLWDRKEPFRAQHAFIELPLMRNDDTVEAPVNQRTLTRRYTDEAVRFIRDNRDRPFFLYLPHTFPHLPTYAGADFDGRSPHGHYADSVEEVDWSTGVILDTLAELGLDRRTLVVFTSDNGPTAARGGPKSHWGDRGIGGSPGPLRGWKGTTWEGGMCVPAVFRWPGRIPAGHEIAEVASILDILPTVAALAGVAPPRDKVIDGGSLRGLLEGRSSGLGERLFCYYFGDQLQAVRQGRWKLVRKLDEYPPYPTSLWFVNNEKLFQAQHRLQAAPELYDLGQDIGEKNNVAGQFADVVRKLEKLAEEFDAGLQRDKQPPVFAEEGAQLWGGVE